MAKAAPKTRNGKPRTERGVKHPSHLAAKERDAKIEPALRELSHLSAEQAAAELDRLGFGRMSFITIARARVRLGILAPRRVRTDLAAE